MYNHLRVAIEAGCIPHPRAFVALASLLGRLRRKTSGHNKEEDL